LVIDDDILLCDLLSTRFTELGWVVESCHDGGEAMTAIWDFNPHILLIDSVLPHTPGVDIVKQVRASPLVADLPIVMISGAYGNRPESLAMKAGADNFLRKPFDTEDLIDIVCALLSGEAHMRIGNNAR